MRGKSSSWVPAALVAAGLLVTAASAGAAVTPSRDANAVAAAIPAAGMSIGAASFLSIPFFKIMGDYDLLDTYWALIFAMTTFAAPYALWVLWDYAKTIPNEIDESAAIDGAGPVAIFFRMYLPLITPTLIAVGTYAFFFAWNEYLYAVLLLQGEKMITLPVGMGNFLTSDDAPWNLLMALSVIYSIPPVIFYYIFRRYLTHGLVSGAVQGT